MEYLFEKLQSSDNSIPAPYEAVIALVQNYLKKGTGLILDIGCETGKNAIPLIEAGYKVTLLDIAPKAIEYTQKNLKNRGLDKGIYESVIRKIEDLELSETSSEFSSTNYKHAFS